MAAPPIKVMRYGEPVLRDGKQLYDAWAKPKGGNRKHKRGTNLKALKHWQAEVEAEEVVPAGTDISLADFIAHNKAALNRGLRKRSLDWYESYFKAIVRDEKLGKKRLDQLNYIDIGEWIHAADSDASKRGRYVAINKVLRFAVQSGDLRVNPCGDLTGPARPKKTKASKAKMVILTPPEVDRLASLVDDRYRALIYVLAHTGARINEALGLTVDRVDWNYKGITIVSQGDDEDVKTMAGERYVPILLPHIQEILRNHIERYSDKFVFTTERHMRTRKPMSDSGFRTRHWYPALLDFGRHMRIHDLRHTAISTWIAQGEDLQRIKSWSGHSLTELTETYSHLFAKRSIGDAEARAAAFRAEFGA